MADDRPDLLLRHTDSLAELDSLEPLWGALQDHHAKVKPALGAQTPPRDGADAWQRRRAKYERWLAEPETFFVLAEIEARAVGYAFVTVGPGYAGWQTGERLAVLETLSVLPEERSASLGAALLEAVWARLAQIGVEELVITTAITNIDSHRFYERHGFSQEFVVYYGKRDH